MTEKVFTPVYNHYKNTACSGNPSEKQCSLKQIAYSQWAKGSILSNPLSNMPSDLIGANSSYVRIFPNFT